MGPLPFSKGEICNKTFLQIGKAAGFNFGILYLFRVWELAFGIWRQRGIGGVRLVV
jgi:hypothetical protein